MNIPGDVVNKFRCSECNNFLNRSPVYVKFDEEAICNECFNPEIPAIRVRCYENAARLLSFPCKYMNYGCKTTVPFVDETFEIPHEEICSFRQYMCPMLGLSDCDWSGHKSSILNHCRVNHQKQVVKNPVTLTHDIQRSNSLTYLLFEFDELFILYTKICVSRGKIIHMVRHLGDAVSAKKFTYSVDVKRGGFLLSFDEEVLSQGSLTLNETHSVVINIDSLLGLIDKFAGTTFTITLKQQQQEVTLVSSKEISIPATYETKTMHTHSTLVPYKERKETTCKQELSDEVWEDQCFGFVSSKKSKEVELSSSSLSACERRNNLHGIDGLTTSSKLYPIMKNQQVSSKREMLLPWELSEDSQSDEENCIFQTTSCFQCKDDSSELVFYSNKKWKCENCAPDKRQCKNNFCFFEDFNKKCWKHETYFCPSTKWCRLCDNKNIPEYSLLLHYKAAHKAYKAGSKGWRVNKGDICLISSDVVGTAICECKMFKSQFILTVFTSLPTERLNEYCCTIQITRSDTNESREFKPELSSFSRWSSDWHVNINKFHWINCTLDITININNNN